MVEVVIESCYREIFDRLRELPEETQKKMLLKFYSEFPNGENVAERIYVINNIKWGSADSVGEKTDAIKKGV